MAKRPRPPRSHTEPATDVVPLELIQSYIRVIRGVRVMLDADLAALYGVPTKRLNEQVKRNIRRFPEDFCFQLTPEESADLRSHFATSSGGHGGRRFLPYAFTEHGAIQAANILNSEAATRMSVAVVRAFVRLRQLVVNHKAIAAKLAELDARVGAHDEQLAALVEAIRLLTTPEAQPPRRRIGFHRE